MSRQSRYLGTPGKITTTREANGAWCAKTRFRDFDGVTRQLRASGRSASAATNELNRKIAERSIPSGGSDLTPESHLSDLITFGLMKSALKASSPNPRWNSTSVMLAPSYYPRLARCGFGNSLWAPSTGSLKPSHARAAHGHGTPRWCCLPPAGLRHATTRCPLIRCATPPG